MPRVGRAALSGRSVGPTDGTGVTWSGWATEDRGRVAPALHKFGATRPAYYTLQESLGALLLGVVSVNWGMIPCS